jgi:hypothetical protein
MVTVLYESISAQLFADLSVSGLLTGLLNALVAARCCAASTPSRIWSRDMKRFIDFETSWRQLKAIMTRRNGRSPGYPALERLIGLIAFLVSPKRRSDDMKLRESAII